MADKPPQPAETAPDPDEDDLDDLDDVLDEFDSKPTLPTSSKPTASGPGRPPVAHSQPGIDPAAPSETAIDDAPEEDFTKQLQAGMSSLVSELGENPEMQAQFEKMMEELLAAGQAGTDKEAREHVKRASESLPQAPEEARDVKSGGKKEDNFQETIRKTMERMQASDTSAAATATASSAGGGAGGGSEEEMLMEMLKSMSAGEGGGEGGEEDFNKMLMSMMTQLTNKEILYEPMKELDTKFPAWMEKNQSGVKKADLERYKEQQRLVKEIVARFERSGYSDENEDDREYIVERMTKMQAAGSPPPDLVGDMSAAQEALGELDQGCPTQ